MAILALVVLVAWLGLVTVVRGLIHYRQTGKAPIRARVEPGSAQWWARLTSSVGVLLAVAAPLAELAGLAPIGVLDHQAIRIGGLVLAIAGIAGTLAAQTAMGDSWRGDVDPEARTRLVTTGPFRLVRNPIMTCTGVTAIGLALMVPNLVSALMLAAILTAINVQVRLAEEPYLERVHGDAYRRYAAATGRFIPGLGRLRRSA
jgi:protein-S-isoprenylcysteine O-methyltransferase Ste14